MAWPAVSTDSAGCPPCSGCADGWAIHMVQPCHIAVGSWSPPLQAEVGGSPPCPVGWPQAAFSWPFLPLVCRTLRIPFTYMCWGLSGFLRGRVLLLFVHFLTVSGAPDSGVESCSLKSAAPSRPPAPQNKEHKESEAFLREPAVLGVTCKCLLLTGPATGCVWMPSSLRAAPACVGPDLCGISRDSVVVLWRWRETTRMRYSCLSCGVDGG